MLYSAGRASPFLISWPADQPSQHPVYRTNWPSVLARSAAVTARQLPALGWLREARDAKHRTPPSVSLLPISLLATSDHPFVTKDYTVCRPSTGPPSCLVQPLMKGDTIWRSWAGARISALLGGAEKVRRRFGGAGQWDDTAVQPVGGHVGPRAVETAPSFLLVPERMSGKAKNCLLLQLGE